MKHVYAISKVPAPGATTDSTAELAISFLIAILSAIRPLLAVLDKSATT